MAKNPHGPNPPQEGLLSRSDGCKVGWCIYQTREQAEKCAQWARAEADIKRDLGYDFGYCAPGEIVTDKNGKFVVTIP